MTSDVMTNTETPYPELSVRSSSLLQELTSLPLVQSMGSAYTRMRDSNWVLKSGLGLVEDTCSVVVDKIHIGSAFAIKIDRSASEGVVKLKRRYPSITTPTEEMVKSSQDTATFMFHKTVRKLVRTYPGQIALKMFDWSVEKADRMLRKMNPPLRSPRKRRSTRASLKRIEKEHAYASEDSGACDTAETKIKEEPLVHSKHIKEVHVGLTDRLFRLGLIYPMEFSVSTLKKTRRYLHAVSQKRKKLDRQPDLSPEKEAEIEARRKVSPRKKRPVSFITRIKQSAFVLFGCKERQVQPIIVEDIESASPNREEAEKKRKHDEILTDLGSEESDDDDLATFDLENYDSAEDPDYEPEDSDALSEYTSDAETESDIEPEPTGEKRFMQLKEKKQVSVDMSSVETIKQEHKEKIQKEQKEKTQEEIKQSGMPKHKAPGPEGTMAKDDVKPHKSSQKTIKEEPKETTHKEIKPAEMPKDKTLEPGETKPKHDGNLSSKIFGAGQKEDLHKEKKQKGLPDDRTPKPREGMPNDDAWECLG